AFFFSSRRRHTRSDRDWSSDVCSSDLGVPFRHSPIGGTELQAIFELECAEPVRRHRRLPRVLAENAIKQCLLVELDAVIIVGPRSEERRVGKECRSEWGADEGKRDGVA